MIIKNIKETMDVELRDITLVGEGKRVEVEMLMSSSGTLWVNLGPKCVLRIYGADNVKIRST